MKTITRSASALACLAVLTACSSLITGGDLIRPGEATALPVDDGAFDAVVCAQVLEYVPDVAAALAEFRRVLQILLNLVTNAVRYSPDGTEVLLDVGIEDDWAVISVSDQGFGIKPDDAEKIFEKFERLGRSGDGGSGLGLYISRRLARAMRGDLSVAEAEGGGAKFSLRLPRN